jgi:putative transposase
MNNFLLENQQKEEKIALLTEFVSGNPEPRELKRALAVKMALGNQPYAQIMKLLGINKSCITYWKQRFVAQGLEGIKLGYQGSKSYLTEQQRVEVISWLRTKDSWDFQELVTYIDVHYEVVYASRQSYYALFSEANISWKKSQKINPKRDPELVEKKREEIQEFIRDHQSDIETGRLAIFF